MTLRIVQNLRYHLPVYPPFPLLIQSLSSTLGLCNPQPTRTLSKKCASYVQRDMKSLLTFFVNLRTPLTQRQLPLDVRSRQLTIGAASLASGIGESDNSVTQKKPKVAGSVLEGNQARLLDLLVSFEGLVVTPPPEPSLV